MQDPQDQAELKFVMNSIRRKIKFQLSNNQKYSSLVGLMLHEKGQKALQVYKDQNQNSIFKMVCNNTDGSNAHEMLKLYENLLNMATGFGSTEIENLEDFNVSDIFEIHDGQDIKIKHKMMWSLVQFWKVNSSENYEEIKEKIVKYPNLKALILAKENRTEEFKNEFEKIISESFINNIENPIKSVEMQEKCLTIAQVSAKNFNLDILENLISYKNLDLELRLKIVLIACKFGFHETLRTFCKNENSKDIPEKYAKKMMYAIMIGVKMRQQNKSFRNVFNAIVNHDFCFDILYNNKLEMSLQFMKQALNINYDGVILLVLKNGYYIGRRNNKKTKFLTDCVEETLFRKILDNCVTLERYKQEDNLKCLKIDYRFLCDDLNKDEQVVTSSESHGEEGTELSLLGNEMIEKKSNTIEFVKNKDISWFTILSLLSVIAFWISLFFFQKSQIFAYTSLIFPCFVVCRTIYKLKKERKSYIQIENSLDLMLIACGVQFVNFIFNFFNNDFFNASLTIFIGLSVVEFLVQIESTVRQKEIDNGLTRNPLELILKSKNVNKCIDHPVLITYIEIMDKKFAKYNRWNFAVFVVSWVMLLTCIGIYLYFEYFAFYLYIPCPIFVSVREGIQLMLYGKRHFSSVVNWIELGLIFSGLVGASHNISDDKTIFHVSTAMLIIFSVLELILLWSKLWKYILITMSMFLRVTMIYAKLIFIFSFVLIGFTLTFILIFSPAEKVLSDVANAPTKSNTNINDFQGFFYTFLKVLIMLTGEFEAASLAIEHWYRFLFFVIFVFVAVTVFNFMNAIAIEEVDGLKKGAEFFVLYEKLHKICEYENHLSRIKNHMGCFGNFFMSFSKRIENLRVVFIETTERSLRTNVESKFEILKIDQELCDKLLALT